MYKRLIMTMLAALCLMTGCGKIKDNTTVVLTTGWKADEVFYIEHSGCSLSEFMIYLTNMRNQYETAFGNEIFEIEHDGVGLEDTLKDQTLEKLASVKIMNLLAEQKNIELTEDEFVIVKNAAELYFSELNETEVDAFKADYDLIENMYKELALAEKVYKFLIADINPEISDDEARTITVQQIHKKTYYVDENGEKVSLSDLSLKEAQTAILEAKNQLDEGIDFASVALEYSDDETLTYSFGKGAMEERYERTAFSLSQGEVSNVFKNDEGYYILKCITTFNKAETDRNKIKIVEERRKEVFEDEYNKFTKQLIRFLNEELYQEISLFEDENIKTNSFFRYYESFINS